MGKLENVGQMKDQSGTSLSESGNQQLTRLPSQANNLIQSPVTNSFSGDSTPGTGDRNLTHMTSQSNHPTVQFPPTNPVYGHPLPETAHPNLTQGPPSQANYVHSMSFNTQGQLPVTQYHIGSQFQPTDTQPGIPMAPSPQITGGTTNLHLQVLNQTPSVNDVSSVGVPWSTNLFDCYDDLPNAIITTVSPCSTFGQIAEILDNGDTRCPLGGLVYSLSFLVLCHWNLASMYRRKLRMSYDLVEAPLDDRLAHIIFPLCSLCQEYRELKNKGRDPSVGYQSKSDNVEGGTELDKREGLNPPLRMMMTRCCKNFFP